MGIVFSLIHLNMVCYKIRIIKDRVLPGGVHKKMKLDNYIFPFLTAWAAGAGLELIVLSPS